MTYPCFDIFDLKTLLLQSAEKSRLLRNMELIFMCGRIDSRKKNC